VDDIEGMKWMRGMLEDEECECDVCGEKIESGE
jgi:hypothetical protein